MPYINLKITKTGVTKEQKQKIAAEMTDTLVRILGKRPENIHIVIDEVELDNWAFSGKLTSDMAGKKPADPGNNK